MAIGLGATELVRDSEHEHESLDDREPGDDAVAVGRA